MADHDHEDRSRDTVEVGDLRLLERAVSDPTTQGPARQAFPSRLVRRVAAFDGRVDGEQEAVELGLGQPAADIRAGQATPWRATRPDPVP